MRSKYLISVNLLFRYRILSCCVRNLSNILRWFNTGFFVHILQSIMTLVSVTIAIINVLTSIQSSLHTKINSVHCRPFLIMNTRSWLAFSLYSSLLRSKLSYTAGSVLTFLTLYFNHTISSQVQTNWNCLFVVHCSLRDWWPAASLQTSWFSAKKLGMPWSWLLSSWSLGQNQYQSDRFSGSLMTCECFSL